MGQVFTAGDIRWGRIPTPEAFKVQEQKVREALLQEDAIESALVFGSVMRGDHTIRSDFDCAVVYRWDARERALGLMERLCVEASWAHVPLVFAFCDSGIAQSRAHYFGPSFRAHLERAQLAGGGIKGEVPKHFAPSRSLQDEILSYLAHKLHKLQAGRVKHCSEDESYRVRYLQKMLEAPIHVARKVLLYRGCLRGDSKAEVLGAYRAEMSESAASELESLIELDRLYTQELGLRLADKNIYEYSEHLGGLFSQANKVIEFVRQNIGVVEFDAHAAR